MRLGTLALVLLAALLAGGSARAAPSEDLAGLSNHEYVDYVRDRFEWLTGEGRSSHHLAKKFRRQCDEASTPGANTDSERACEIVKAADAQSAQVLQEGQDLIEGLQKRLGNVPSWAREADANLKQSVGK